MLLEDSTQPSGNAGSKSLAAKLWERCIDVDSLPLLPIKANKCLPYNSIIPQLAFE